MCLLQSDRLFAQRLFAVLSPGKLCQHPRLQVVALLFRRERIRQVEFHTLLLQVQPEDLQALQQAGGVIAPQCKADIAHGFQQAVIDTLLIKCRRALQSTGLTQLVLAGGVSANRELRERLRDEAQARGWRVFYPRAEFCTDNGAMVAFAGCQRLLAGQHDDLAVRAQARWPIDTLEPVA